MKKYLFLFPIFIIVLLAMRSKGGSPTLLNEPLKIGVLTPYQPYATLNGQGKLQGFDIAIAREIGKRLRKEIIFQDMPLASLLLALQQNKLDMVLSGLSITQERQQAMTMLYYYGEPVYTFPLLFWKEKPAAVKSLADVATLPNAVVCVEAGSAQEQFIKKEYPNLELSYLPAIADIVMALKYNKATAALIDPETLPSIQRLAPELVAVEVELPVQFQSQGVGVAINSKNRALSQQVSLVIEQMDQDGTIAQYAAEWF